MDFSLGGPVPSPDNEIINDKAVSEPSISDEEDFHDPPATRAEKRMILNAILDLLPVMATIGILIWAIAKANVEIAFRLVLFSPLVTYLWIHLRTFSTIKRITLKPWREEVLLTALTAHEYLLREMKVKLIVLGLVPLFLYILQVFVFAVLGGSHHRSDWIPDHRFARMFLYGPWGIGVIILAVVSVFRSTIGFARDHRNWMSLLFTIPRGAFFVLFPAFLTYGACLFSWIFLWIATGQAGVDCPDLQFLIYVPTVCVDLITFFLLRSEWQTLVRVYSAFG